MPHKDWKRIIEEAIARANMATPTQASLEESSRLEAEDLVSESDNSSSEDSDMSLVKLEADMLVLDEISLPWTPGSDGLERSGDWTKSASAHRADIELLAVAVSTTNLALPTVVEKLNRSVVPSLDELIDEVAKMGASAADTKRELGNLVDIVQEHGSVSAAFASLFMGNQVLAASVSRLTQDMTRMSDDVAEYAQQAQTTKQYVIQLISRVNTQATKSIQSLMEKLSELQAEQAHASFDQQTPHTGFFTASSRVPHHHPFSTPPGNSMTADGVTGPVMADTSFGVMKLGGQSINVSINSLVNIINSMAAKIELLEERTSSTGVTFNKMTFASQSEFTRWFTEQNPSGDGL